MKTSKKILACALAGLLAGGLAAGAQETAEADGTEETAAVVKEKHQKLSASFDMFNSSFAGAINVEYSPNKYLDIGMGYTPAFFIIPAVETHLFARVCFLDYFIQPYLQLGVSILQPGFIGIGNGDENTVWNESWFNARVGTGVKFSFGKYFFCGIGGGYSFVGQDSGPMLNWHGLYPSVFLGCSFLRF